MGGGGGLFGGEYTPDKYRQILRETQESTRDAQYETEVNSLIGERLGEYHRDTDTTREHLEEIKDILQEDDIGTIELQYGGSVRKHTYVDGLSDVDILVEINKTELVDESHRTVLRYIKQRLTEDSPFDSDHVRVGKLAVTITYYDGEEIQLLPALRIGDGYRIPSVEGDRWSHIINPNRFATKLTEVNQANNGKVVPTLKLAKDIMTTLPRTQQLNGYHIESIGIEIYENYPDEYPHTPKAMLKYFFHEGKEVVKHPIKDSTNQSLHVDDYLGAENSVERMRISYSMDRIYRRMNNADEIGSVDEWRSILGD
jgi:predicted nucleotidyltransferase